MTDFFLRHPKNLWKLSTHLCLCGVKPFFAKITKG